MLCCAVSRFALIFHPPHDFYSITFYSNVQHPLKQNPDKDKKSCQNTNAQKLTWIPHKRPHTTPLPPKQHKKPPKQIPHADAPPLSWQLSIRTVISDSLIMPTHTSYTLHIQKKHLPLPHIDRLARVHACKYTLTHSK